MKKQIIALLIISVFGTLLPPVQLHAQEAEDIPADFSPVEALRDEAFNSLINEDTGELTDEIELQQALSDIDGALTESEQAFGGFNADGEFIRGSLGRLKLKPSDIKRLQKIANGSITERERERIKYDQELLNLLVRLVTPKEFGGGGMQHLRVGDLLRFRNDPRSRETEQTDNISQHQWGKAADIIEINKTHCTKESLLGGSENLPPFPVKVIWQGGAPYNPSIASLGSFDAAARQNAFRDILGSLPGDSYNGAIQGFADLLQQVQRRVLAQELGLGQSDLDYLVNNDVLETLGRVAVNASLGLPATALTGGNADEMLRSIPQAYVEEALQLPPRSLAGSDDWNKALENIGRIKVALDIDVDPQAILRGEVDKIRTSPYYQYYRRTEAAYRLAQGTYDGIRNNRPESFRQIGALLLADRLHYAEAERDELLAQAASGTVKRLNLGRFGDFTNMPANPLPMLAPADGSSKAAGETFLAKLILGGASNVNFDELPNTIRDAIASRLPLLKTVDSRQDITSQLLSTERSSALYREIGAGYMEEAFDLPKGSLTEAITKHGTPSLEQFLPILERHAKTEARETGDTQATASITGRNYFETTFRESFQALYHTSTVGLASITNEEMYSLLVGQVSDAATRAGASWVEEDLGLAPDSFSVFFTRAAASERLVNAGISVLAGELFEAFEVDGRNVNNGETFKLRIGQARVESALGLKPGSFRDSIDGTKDQNQERYNTIFASPDMVDTILGLERGSSKRLLDHSLSPRDYAIAVGSVNLHKLDTDNLENKFGWDGRFAIDGDQLLRTIESADGTTVDAETNETVSLRSILAKIGGYNTSFAFGYHPNFTDNWINAGSIEEQNRIIVNQGGRLYADRLGYPQEQRDVIIESYRVGDRATIDRAVDIFRRKFEIPIPEQDVLSIVEGDMVLVQSSRAAAQEAQRVLKDVANAYEVFRVLVYGSSSDPNFEVTLSQEAQDRYTRILTDYAILKRDELLDTALDRITKGVLNATGIFDPNGSPYSDIEQTIVKLGYFASKEARNEYFYGVIDAAIRQKDPSLPADFSKDLIEGSMSDRSAIILDYLGTKIATGILDSLPPEVISLARTWFETRDAQTGVVLSLNTTFTNWASSALSQYTDGQFSAQTIQLALSYVSGTFNPTVIQENPSLGLELGALNMAAFVNKQLGLPTGEFTAYYEKYQQMRSLYTEFKAGNLDVGQAVFAVDALLFDGKLAGLTHSLDEALGLPAGSTQLLIQFAITQNPIYLAQFVFNIFFGVTIECPDLQEEAKKNVKKLLTEIIDLGEHERAIVPSQIIVFHQSYIRDLLESIKKNYAHCLAQADARCGVFARPEYAKQVHIGF